MGALERPDAVLVDPVVRALPAEARAAYRLLLQCAQAQRRTCFGAEHVRRLLRARGLPPEALVVLEHEGLLVQMDSAYEYDADGTPRVLEEGDMLLRTPRDADDDAVFAQDAARARDAWRRDQAVALDRVRAAGTLGSVGLEDWHAMLDGIAAERRGAR